jgi:hypothetical protein
LGFLNVKEVFNPTDTELVEPPEDLAGWLQHHPYLQTDKPKPVTVGGVKGEQFDWVLAEDAPTDEIPTFSYSDGSSGDAGKGFKYRAIVLEEVKGETVIIDFGAPPGEKFDEFTFESQRVVDSVKWRGS